MAVTSARPARSGRALPALRGSSFGALVMLIIQFSLGIWVNLYATIPASDKGGLFNAIGKALSNGPASLASHAGFGLLILLAAIGAVARAIIARHALGIVLSVIGLLAVIGAALNGARFVADGGPSNASLAMALLTAVAMLCYAILVFMLGMTRPAPAGGSS
jgi:hypothetical protein